MSEADPRQRHQVAAAALGAAFFCAALIVLIRELTVLSGGAETAAGVAAGAAMFWAGVGALLARRFGSHLGERWCAWMLAVQPPLFCVVIWAVRLLVAPVAGEENLPLLLWAQGLAALLLTVPSGLTCGAILPLAAERCGSAGRIWPAVCGGMAAAAAGVALASALGCGQLLMVAVICGVFAPLVSAILGPRLLRRGKMALAAWTVIVFGCALCAVATPLSRDLTLASAHRGGALETAGNQVASELDVPGGNLVVIRGEGESVRVYHDGVLRARYPDPHARDDAVFACSQAEVIGRALVIGGGRPGLVRELLARGVAKIHVLHSDQGLQQALAAHVNDADREALESPRVKHIRGNFQRRLREARAESYDLALLDVPQPWSAGNSRFYSVEFLATIAVTLVRRGVLVATVPAAGPRSRNTYASRIWATFWELGEKRLLRSAIVFPGRRWRVAASPMSGGLAADPAGAAKRYRRHRMPAGGEPAAAGDEDFSRLVNAKEALEFTERLDARRKRKDLFRESALTPRMHLDFQAASLQEDAPGLAYAVRKALRVHLWVPFAALLGLFLVGGLIARRKRGSVPGSFTMSWVAGTVGLVSVGCFYLACTTYSLQSGVLYGALPLLTSAACAGAGLGASLVGRVGGAIQRSPRRSLSVVAFGMLLITMMGWQSVLLPPGSAWVDLAHGMGLAVLGLLAGLELALISASTSGRNPPSAVVSRLISSLGAGALLGAGLTGSLLLASMGPASSYLLMLAVSVVSLGMLAAGVGRRRSRGSSTSLPSPVPPPSKGD